MLVYIIEKMATIFKIVGQAISAIVSIAIVYGLDKGMEFTDLDILFKRLLLIGVAFIMGGSAIENSITFTKGKSADT